MSIALECGQYISMSAKCENEAQQAGPATPLMLGEIGQPYGVKGWVRVTSFCSPPDNILEYTSCWLQYPSLGSKPKVWERAHVRVIKPHGKRYVCLLEGVSDRDAAEALRGAQIAISRDELPGLESGDFYWFELMGLPVRTLAGEYLGVIDTLLETGANDVMVVIPTPESLDDRRRLIPYRLDDVVKSVSLEPAGVVVDWDVDF